MRLERDKEKAMRGLAEKEKSKIEKELQECKEAKIQTEKLPEELEGTQTKLSEAQNTIQS